jgi:hypothetical protein
MEKTPPAAFQTLGKSPVSAASCPWRGGAAQQKGCLSGALAPAPLHKHTGFICQSVMHSQQQHKFSNQMLLHYQEKKQSILTVAIQHLHRGEDNHSPNVSKIQDWRVKIQTHLPAWRGFLPLSLTISISWASCFLIWCVKILVLLTSLVSVLKNLSTPLTYSSHF